MQPSTLSFLEFLFLHVERNDWGEKGIVWQRTAEGKINLLELLRALFLFHSASCVLLVWRGIMMWKGVTSLQKFWSQFNSNHKFGGIEGLEIFPASFLVASCTLRNAVTYPSLAIVLFTTPACGITICSCSIDLCVTCLGQWNVSSSRLYHLRGKALSHWIAITLSVPSSLKAVCPLGKPLCSLSPSEKLSSLAHSRHRIVMPWKAVDLDVMLESFVTAATLSRSWLTATFTILYCLFIVLWFQNGTTERLETWTAVIEGERGGLWADGI